MSLTRSEQSKLNGAKSTGPITSEGKARSAINRTSHGMYSNRVVLETESNESFQIFAGIYHDLFQPADQFESDLVDSLVHARWKIRRLEAAHTSEIDLTIAEHQFEFAEKYGTLGPDQLHALAYRHCGKYLETLDKHLDRQERLFSRTYRNLARHRRNRPIPSLEDLHDAELDIPSHTQNERFEPETPNQPVEKEPFEPSGPNPLQKIALVLILLLTSLTFNAHVQRRDRQEALPYSTMSTQRTEFPHVSL